MDNIWLDLRLVPAYTCGASLLLLLCKLLLDRFSQNKPVTGYAPVPIGDDDAAVATGSLPHGSRFHEHIRSRGGKVIYAFLLLRLVGCIALAVVSAVAVDMTRADGLLPHMRASFLTPKGKAELALTMAYVYASIMAAFALIVRPALGRFCDAQAALVLLIQFAVFGWRNLVPFMSFGGEPADSAILWLMITRGTLLGLAGVVIPLLIPQIYQPVDPLNPAAEPNPEQTASILSFITWSFLDPIIWAAYRTPKLPYESLPPLPDTDWANHLEKRAMDRLDPLRRKERGWPVRHLFLGIMTVFWKDYLKLSVIVVLLTLIQFFEPIGINRLLSYLETNGRGAVVRPWVWIMMLLLSPLCGSVIRGLYLFITTRIVVQGENVILQVIFQHALRVRLTSEKADATPPPATETEEATTSEVEQSNAPVAGAQGDSEVSTLVESDAQSGSQSQTASSGSPVPAQKKPVTIPVAQKPQPAPTASTVTGKINNLVGTDIGNITDARDFLMLVLETPLQVALSIWFLYALLGWAAFVGMAVMIAMLPLPGLVAKLQRSIQQERMKKTDVRVQAITDSMNEIRMVKMFGWQAKITKDVFEKRQSELVWVLKMRLWNLFLYIINTVIPTLTMVVSFSFYTLVLKQDLTASRIFSSVVVFDKLRGSLMMSTYFLTSMIKAKVSLDRVNEFLTKTEVLDQYALSTAAALAPSTLDTDAVGFHNASFTWSEPRDRQQSGSTRNFTLHVDHLIFEPRAINLIVGATGSGKTSMLMALLGEMHFLGSGSDSWFNLPRTNGVAYAAQESWVQNDTIKQNILFGTLYDESRYRKVISQCALEPDLALLDAGDETEVGEKGITLSGGQKARITLARAIYSRADILLLDDVLSALDVHTARWIVDKCFRGDLIEGRTVILVTHAVALATPVAASVITLDYNGRVLSQNTVSRALAVDGVFRREMEESASAIDATEATDGETPEMAKEQVKGKLILAEEMAEGRLGLPAFKLLGTALGGPIVWILSIGALGSTIFVHIMSTWWLGVWSSAYEGTSGKVDAFYYLGVYVLFLVVEELVHAVGYIFYQYCSIRAARTIHSMLVDSVLSTTLRWLDVTPVGRIISRFTQDMRDIDGALAQRLWTLTSLSLEMLLQFGAVIFVSPIFIIPGVVIFAVGALFGQVYVNAQLPLKRYMSNSRSPVYSHFTAAVNGLTSIRAFGAEGAFRAEFFKRLDHYCRPSRTFYNVNRWISFRTSILGGFFTAGLATYLVYFRMGIGAGITGFSLSMAAGFMSMILYWVRTVNDFEVSGNSLERIRDYLAIEQEPAATESGRPPAYWPASGKIRVENLCARYSPEGPMVLDDICFEIKSGERIGIVGRTGSGKSSLALSLLRMIPTTGAVYIDGLPTHEVNLDELRAKLSIIPQEPMLMSGSLRSNLDPFSEQDDAVLNDALRSVGLNAQTDSAHGRINLDTTVSAGGSNFSVGQRQLMALARAIVRNTKVLILDEATASVDEETDNVIQASIRGQLMHTTLITIAHRLQTIADYDKIMVLDAGKLVEFDSPIALLENEASYFRALVEQSGDREKLWEAARKGRAN